MPFSFFHNSLKWWSMYMKFLPDVAEEILIQNMLTKYGCLLGIVCQSWSNVDVILCCEYKLARRNQCWQLLNSCPSSMMNFVWFTDDKLLKFYHYKNAQNHNFHTLVGIAWLLHFPARQCTSTHRLPDGWVFRSWDAWFHVLILLNADTMNIFHQWTTWSSPSKQGSNS